MHPNSIILDAKLALVQFKLVSHTKNGMLHYITHVFI